MPVEIHPEMPGLYGDPNGLFKDVARGALTAAGAIIVLPYNTVEGSARVWRSIPSCVKWSVVGGLSFATFISGVNHLDPLRIGLGGLGTGFFLGYVKGRYSQESSSSTSSIQTSYTNPSSPEPYQYQE